MRKVEKYYPLVLSLFAGCATMCVCLCYPSLLVLAKELLKSEFLSIIVTIETTLFGFLLAILAIVLQLKGTVIDRIKRYNRFPDLINYNKASVAGCALTLVFATMLILFDKWMCCAPVVALWIGLLVYNILSTYRFVSIFYVIAKSG